MPEDIRGLILILTGNVMIGNHIASLMDAHSRQAQVVHSDVQAYNIILKGIVDAVVADIDDVALGGLSVLALCKHHNPSITTYAICHDGNSKPMHLARGLSCAGYFYLKKDETQQLDTNRGMAAQFTFPVSTDEPVHPPNARKISHAG